MKGKTMPNNAQDRVIHIAK